MDRPITLPESGQLNRPVTLPELAGVSPTTFVTVGALGGFFLLLLAVQRFGLPLWMMLPVVAAGVYVFAVLHRPMIGVYAVVATFFTPVTLNFGLSLLQTVGAGTAALLMVWFFYHRRTIVFGRFMIPLTLLGVLILSSLLWTRDAEATLGYFLRWAFNMMFIFLLLNLVTKFEQFKKILWAIIVMAALNSVVAVYQYITAYDYYHRSTGLMANPNNFGQLATLAFPLALYQYIYSKGWKRWLGLALSGILAAGIVTSVSRGALVSLIVVFFVVLFLERRRAIPLLLVGALAVASIPFLPTFFIDRVGNLNKDVANSVLVGQQTTLTSRGHINAAGIKIWSAYPILGVGIGNFGYYYNQREFIGGMTAGHKLTPHNIYMQALSEMGLVGFTLLIWMLFNSAVSLYQARKVTDRRGSRWVYFGAIEMMTLSILIATASTGSVMGNDLWMFLGLTMIASRVAKDKEDS